MNPNNIEMVINVSEYNFECLPVFLSDLWTFHLGWHGYDYVVMVSDAIANANNVSKPHQHHNSPSYHILSRKNNYTMNGKT